MDDDGKCERCGLYLMNGDEFEDKRRITTLEQSLSAIAHAAREAAEIAQNSVVLTGPRDDMRITDDLTRRFRRISETAEVGNRGGSKSADSTEDVK